MDIKQLTKDFGGSLEYNHKSWIKFMTTVDDLEETINKTLDKLPEAHDKLSMMCEYDIPDSQSEAELLLAQIRRKYQDVMRDLNLEHTIDECKAVIQQLTDPSNADYKDITHTQSYSDARKNLTQYKQQLIHSREGLKGAWQVAETRVMLVTRVRKYKVKATKVIDWIKEVGLPSVKDGPEIASCLSQAEIQKTQYETGFYSLAKNVLWLADKIQKKLNEAVAECQTSVPDLLPFSKSFRSSVEYFRKLLLKKHTVYLNVYQFFTSSQKSPSVGVQINSSQSMYTFLLQLTKWYRRTLDFLPLQLLTQQPVVHGDYHDVVFYGSSAWTASANNYLLHHPAPKPQHVDKLKNILPVIDNIGIRNQARLLVHRVGVLCALLMDPSRVQVSDMQGVLRWRNQVNEGHDDITLNFNSSTLNLVNLGELAAAAADQGLSRATSELRVAPKLRAVPTFHDDGPKPNNMDYLSLDRNLGRNISRHRSLPQNAYQARSAAVPGLDLSFLNDSLLESSVDGHQDVGHSPSDTRRTSLERYVSLNYLDSPDIGAVPQSLQHISLDALEENKPQRSHRRIQGNPPTRVGPADRADGSRSNNTPHANRINGTHRSLPDVHGTSRIEPQLDVNTVVNSNLSPEEKLDLMAKICEGKGVEVSEELYYKLNSDKFDFLRTSTGSKTANSTAPPRLRRVRPHSSVDLHKESQTRTPVRPVSALYPHREDSTNLSLREQSSEGKVRLLQSRPLSMYGAGGHHILTESNNDRQSKRDSGFSERAVGDIHGFRPHAGIVPPKFTDASRHNAPMQVHTDYSVDLPNHSSSSQIPVHGELDHYGAPFIYLSQPNLVFQSNPASESNPPGLNQVKKKAPQTRNNPRLPVKVSASNLDGSDSSDNSRGYKDVRWNSSLAVPSKGFPRRRKPSKRSSIKVEEWMQRQGEQFDRLEPAADPRAPAERKRTASPRQTTRSRQEKTKLDPYYGIHPVTRTHHDVAPSLSESLSDKVGPAHDQELALLRQAEIDQDSVEESLHNTEKILQEQEDLLIMDYDLSPSPCSSTSSTTVLNEDEIIAANCSEAASPLVIEPPTPPAPRDERQWEGSLSEESGVYTQTSTDSRFRFPDAAVNGMLGPHGVSVAGALREDSDQEGGINVDNGGSNEHLQVCKEASLGDSSSQTTVMTEIHREQSLSSEGSVSYGDTQTVHKGSRPTSPASGSPGGGAPSQTALGTDDEDIDDLCVVNHNFSRNIHLEDDLNYH